MVVQPYLFFGGRAEEAIDFYRAALGATVDMLMRNEEAPEQPPPGMLPAGSGQKVMHAQMRIGDSVVMISDGMCDGKEQFDGFSLSVTVADDAEAERCFNAWPKAGRCGCRWARRSSPRASACAPTASAWAGWCCPACASGTRPPCASCSS